MCKKLKAMGMVLFAIFVIAMFVQQAAVNRKVLKAEKRIIEDFNHRTTELVKSVFAISDCPDTQLSGAKDQFFSQLNEDYILSNVFAGVDHGFYVDVGANNPNASSVTLYFHNKGWRGMNFEPQPTLHAMFIKDRADDINIQKAVADKEGSATFYVPSEGSPLATLDSKIKDIELGSKEFTVEVTTLTKEFAEHNIQEIDFLKIDVEGFEDKVIAGLDLQRFRPKVIMLEYRSPTNQQGYLLFEPMLIKNGYVIGMDDGILNRYYYRAENPEFAEKFRAIGKCVKMDNMVRGWWAR